MSEITVKGIRCEARDRGYPWTVGDDIVQCGNTFMVQAESIDEARHLARVIGWTRGRAWDLRWDICPECSR